MRKSTPWYATLFAQVMLAILLGVFVGHFFPRAGIALKPLGTGFIALIKMMIAPVVFCMVVSGIGSMGDMKKLGRVGVQTLVYFEVVSTLALIIGLAVGEVFQPGRGLNFDSTALDPGAVTKLVPAGGEGISGRLMAVIPSSFLNAFTGGDVLQVLLVAILCGFVVSRMGELGQKIVQAIGVLAKLVFGIVRLIIKFAPLGAFGAIAFTVGRYRIGSLGNLVQLIATFYITALLFIIVVLGIIARWAGFSIFRFLLYIKDELLIVLGTSSSETVMPDMMQKLEQLGSSRSIVGLVFPTGYSFNTDGSNIYMTLCVLFLAQATNAHLTLGHLVGIVVFAMIASKGGAGVSGNAFITLAAIVATVPEIPIQALAILLGVDLFMSECRALTNVVGNGVATLVVSRWEKEIDMGRVRDIMLHPSEVPSIGAVRVRADISPAISQSESS